MKRGVCMWRVNQSKKSFLRLFDTEDEGV